MAFQKMLIGQIGSVLAHVVHLFHPDAIVVGVVCLALASHCGRLLCDALVSAPSVVLLAKLGEDAVPIGALELITN